MTKVLLVGGGGREDAICRAMVRSEASVYAVLKNENPSILRLSTDHRIMDETDHDKILAFARESGVELAFIGPDPVLNTPLVDRLWQSGIPVASPSLSAARIETSKEYMRSLLARHGISGNIASRTFTDPEELSSYVRDLEHEFVVKPLGLTGGKGVRVMGDHFQNPAEGLAYANDILDHDGKVLIEDKVQGEEFSLQVFTDGSHVAPMPIAQDYKRAYEGDTGPNTGGMGAITDADLSLPFLRAGIRENALGIMRHIIRAMKEEGNQFRGIMYGQFMQTRSDLRVIEVNARFADPEGINVLHILYDDLLEILFGIAEGDLRTYVNFNPLSTALKYIVPVGYGSKPEPGMLEVGDLDYPNVSVYYAAVSGSISSVKMTSSRSLAMIATGQSIEEASDAVERSMSCIRGNFYHRRDIGSRELMKKKIESAGIST
jgi:phosphoribosylamine--glycine ligase